MIALAKIIKYRVHNKQRFALGAHGVLRNQPRQRGSKVSRKRFTDEEQTAIHDVVYKGRAGTVGLLQTPIGGMKNADICFMLRTLNHCLGRHRVIPTGIRWEALETARQKLQAVLDKRTADLKKSQGNKKNQ